jgi:hypothetical protein
MPPRRLQVGHRDVPSYLTPPWMVANLDADALPDFDMMWDQRKKWVPPGS